MMMPKHSFKPKPLGGSARGSDQFRCQVYATESIVRPSANRLALACLLAFMAYSALSAAPPEFTPATAIRIVLDTQQDKIRAVDSPDSWWHDTRERTWSVKRPVGPGVLDTTHTFTVAYSIDGAAVAGWNVDTRAGTAVALP